MDVFEAIRKRRSIRAYLPDQVPLSDLKKILEAAVWAPSAGNLQSWEFVIVRDPVKKKRLVRAALGQKFIAEAPIVIVVGANLRRSSSVYGRRGETLYAIQDTAAAIMNLMLAACALGYGTCWIGAFYEEEVRKIVGFPDYIRPVAIIPLGKPRKVPRPPPRMDLFEVVWDEIYGNAFSFD